MDTKTKQNVLSLILVFSLLFSLAACGGKAPANLSQNEPPTEGGLSKAPVHSEIGNPSHAQEPVAGNPAGSVAEANPDIGNVKGKMVDPGNISVLCPDGWKSFSIPDYISSVENAKNPNGLELRKGTEGEGYQYLMPGLELQYYEHGLGGDEPTNNYEGKSESWGPIELGGRTWQGFIGLDAGKAFIWAKGASEYSLVTMRFELEAEGVEISLDDADVQAIIASLKLP